MSRAFARPNAAYFSLHNAAKRNGTSCIPSNWDKNERAVAISFAQVLRNPLLVTTESELMFSKMSLRALALTLVLPVGAAAGLATISPAVAADPAVSVTISDFGTTNYDGNGAWGVSAPSAPGWDFPSEDAPFSALPADGSKWTLDIEGKAKGSTSITSDGLVLTTVGYSNADPALWALSQKVRYSYFFGSGGYPALDSKMTDGVLPVATFLGSPLSWTGKYVENANAPVHGFPAIEFRAQNPVAPFQRVSFHSNGYTALGSTPVLGAETSTVTPSEADHLWVINSAANDYAQYSVLSTTALAADFANWDVVSFGPNTGRGADGTVTVDSLTALGTTFSFDEPFAGVVPTISGSTSVGKTLTAKTGDWGTGWAFTYRWYRSATKDSISGATKSTYLLTSADLNKPVSVAVTGKRAGVSFTVSSELTPKVARGVIAATPTPKIKGTLKVGKKLTAKPGTWTSGTTLSYSWFRGATKISGATKSTYKLVSKDKRALISVKVTGTKAGFTTVTKTSSKTSKIK